MELGIDKGKYFNKLVLRWKLWVNHI